MHSPVAFPVELLLVSVLNAIVIIELTVQKLPV